MENYSTQITNYLLTQSWQIAVLVAAIAAASWLLKNKSAHIRYLLWLIVLAKCLVPPLLTVPVAILPQPAPPVLVETVVTLPVEPAMAPAAPIPSPPAPIVPEQKNNLTGREWLAVIWIVGAVGFVLGAVIKASRTNLWLWRQRKPLSAELQTGIEGLFAGLGFGSFPKVWLVEGIGQPFVWGLLRGCIYLPANLVRVDNAEQRRGILGHELSHILRFDAAVNFLQIIAQAIFWFHPFVWWANKKIRAEREKCCDEMAIARLGAKAKDYSSAIVNILISEHEQVRPVPSLAVAGPVKNIEERIKTMLRPGKKFYKHPSLLAAIVVLLAALLTVPTALVLTTRAEETKTASQSDEKPRKTLHQAAAEGDIEQVKSLISKGAEVNAKSDRWGGTPLHLAAVMAHKQVIEYLIANGANVNAKNKYGRTPLHDAMDRGQIEIVDLLRKHGAKADTSMGPEKTRPATSFFEALTGKYAIPRQNLQIPDYLRSCAANLQKIYAAIKKYEKDRGSLPNWLSDLVPEYLTKEMLLCPHNPGYRAVRLYFDPNIPFEPKLPCSYRYQFSMLRVPMHFPGDPIGCMIYRDRKMAEVKLFGDVVPLVRCSAHDQVLNISVGGQIYISSLVWSRIFIPDYSRGDELSAQAAVMSLHEAAADGDIEKVKDLISQGADVNTRDGEGRTALHHAARNGLKDVAELLLAKGANVNAKDEDGWAPLHWSADEGYKGMTELLIDKGANINAKGNKGQTALSLAKEQGHDEIVELLHKHVAEE